MTNDTASVGPNTFTSATPSFKCSVHGDVAQNVVSVQAMAKHGTWCMLCIMDMLAKQITSTLTAT